MKIRTLFLVVAAGALLAGTANAKEYVDYQYAKGLWQITQVEVDQNHIDDYLTGLKQSEVPGFEIMKKHGIIDDYSFSVRQGYSKDLPNVVIGVHYVNAEGMMPNQARDQMIEKEIFATFSEEAGKAAIAGYEKYRRFVDSAAWLDIKFTK